MNESLESLFRSDYMPHGHCYWWKPEILWLNVISDLFIAFAYFSIPIAIYYFVKRRTDIQFKGIFILFSLFILFCGITHVISIFVIWNGIYGVHGLAKMATAIVSCITAYKVFESIPLALSLPTQTDLKKADEKVNEERIQRVRLEAKANEELLLRESTNIAHVGVFAFDEEGNVLIANDAACQMFGATKVDIENSSIQMLIEVDITNNQGEVTSSKKVASLHELWGLQSAAPDETGQHVVYGVTSNGERIPLSFKLTKKQEIDNLQHRKIITFASFQDISEQLRYQQALTDSEATTRSIIESLPIGLHVFEKEGDKLVLTGYNRAAEKILDFDHEQILNEQIEQAFPDIANTNIPTIYKDIATNGGHWNDQSIQYEDAQVSGVFDVQCFQSAVDTAIVLFEDVTEKHLAKQSVAEKDLFIQTAFNASITGVIVYNFVTNKIEFVNESFFDITGRTIDEALSMDKTAMINLVHPDDKLTASEHWDEIKNANTDEVTNISYRLKHAQGHWVWCMAKDVVFEKDAQGKVIRYMSSFLDISEMKDMQEHLIKLKEAAEAASAAKSSFLANMSHEIRTPMNAILGLTNIVLKMELGDKQRDYLGRVEASSQSLLSLLNDILDYSKIEAGKLKINSEIFELDFVIQNCTGLFGFLAEQKGIEFVVNQDAGLSKYYLGDPIRLSQIINNLLGNAVKFTSHGQITLHLGVAEAGAVEQLTFTVTDSGIGMSEEQAESLFDAFSQADSSISREYGGTGLGLAISRSLTQLMEGSISFKTSLGEGSEFSVVLPFSRADFSGAETTVTASGSRSFSVNQSTGLDIVEFDNVRALIVEDNATNQLVAREFLRQLNIQSVCVNNGLEAINAVESDVFDFILMDLQMPVMDGFSATRVIRETTGGKDVVIIAMSAAVSESDIERVLNAGMNHHLPKPFNLPLLFHRLSEFLKYKQSSRQVSLTHQKWTAQKCPKGFDIKNAMHNVGGDESLYIRLVQSFAENFEGRQSEIQEAFSVGKFDLVERYAHTVKGLAESMGATDLEIEAKRIELAYANNENADPSALCALTVQAISAIRTLYGIAENSIVAREGGSIETARTMLLELRSTLQSGKFMALEDIETELSNIAEFADDKFIEGFTSALKKLDYKKCLSLLSEVETRLPE